MIFSTFFFRVLIAFILTINVGVFVSQNNRTFNYQAVAHSTNGTTINNTAIDVEISISSDTTIAPEFEESHAVSTNEYGLFSLKIGSINSGDFENIEWAEEDFYLGVAIDGEFMGYQLLVAVPYSFSSIEAYNAEMVNGNTVESNVPLNASFTDNQTISMDSDSLYISNGNALALDNLSTNDNDWTISTNDMYSSNSGKVGIGITNFNPNLGKLNITTDANSKRGLYIINNTSGNATNFGKFGVYAIVDGGGTGDNQGGWFDASGSPGINYGVAGNSRGVSTGENRGVYGAAEGGTSNWAGYFGDDTSPGSGNVKINDQLVIGSNSAAGSFQLIDGNQGAGRILKSDAQGNAQWVQIGSLGVGVMLKNNYDSNNNSIVDNAENAQLINGYQVGTNVPANSVFTDNQTLSGNFNTATNLLTVSIQNGNTHTADLSSLINTDEQQLSGVDYDGDGVLDSIELTNSVALAVSDFFPNLSINDLSNGYEDSNNNLFLIAQPSTLTTAKKNIAIGSNALSTNTASEDNIAIGHNALTQSTVGAQVAIGTNALKDNTTGLRNNALGHSSLSKNTTGSMNNAFGYASLFFNTTGNQNTAIGHWTLVENTTGNSNTAIGKSALYLNTTGHENTAVGTHALENNTNGGENTSLGTKAMKNNTVGGGNVAIGFKSMYNNDDGAGNVAIGKESMYESINGSSNAALGLNSLKHNLGSENTAIGNNAGSNQTISNQNTFVGYNANTSVYSVNSINNSTAIGANATVDISNAMVLGNNVNVGIGTSSPTQKLDVNGDTKISGKLAIGTNPLSGRILGSFGGSWYLGDDTEDPKITIDGDYNGISWSIGVDDQSSGGGTGNADFVISGGSDLNSPKLSLNSAGVNAAGEYNYASSRTRFHTISAVELITKQSYRMATSSGYAYIYDGSSTSVGYVLAPVHLPDEAQIIEVTYFLEDDSQWFNFGQLQFWTKSSLGSTTYDQTSAPTGTYNNQAINLSVNEVIDNENNSYYIRIASYRGNSNLKIHGVRLKYLVNKAD